jgi:uncharacterized protein YjiS (DUF1127 family)
MQIDTLFIDPRALRARRNGPARSRNNVLSELLRQTARWVSSWLVTGGAIAELTAMDDGLLRDIGLRREQPESIRR